MKRDLRLFYAYRMLATSYLFVPTQVKFLAERQLSWTEMLTLNSVFSLVLILFEVPTGAWADRMGRRASMMLGAGLMAVACVGYYISSSFPAFVVAEALCALGMTFTSGPDSAYLFDLLAENGRAADYPKIEGTATSAKYIGMGVASAIGGLMGRRDAALPYLGAAGVCLAAAAVAAFLREAPRVRGSREQRWGGYVPHISRALDTALRGKRLRYTILYSTLIFVLLRISLWLYQPYLMAAGFDVAAIGIIFALLYGVAALSSRHVQWFRARFRASSLYWVLPAVLAGSYLLLGPLVSVWGIVLMGAQKVVDGVYSPLTKDLLNREITDSRQRASVLSVESMVRRVAFTAFAPIAGMLIDEFGRAGAFYLCALVGGLGAGALILRSRAAERAKVAALAR